MKTTYKISGLLFAAFGLFAGSTAAGQEFKTNESVRTQLIQGTTPGLKTGPPVQKQQVENTPPPQYTKGNFKDHLQKISQGSGSAGQGSSAKSAGTPKAGSAKTGSVQLPSDAKTEAAEAQKIEKPKLPPMQTEEKKPG